MDSPVEVPAEVSVKAVVEEQPKEQPKEEEKKEERVSVDTIVLDLVFCNTDFLLLQGQERFCQCVNGFHARCRCCK